MTIKIYGTDYTCEKAVKGTDFVHLYNSSGNLIGSFSGISDFSGYVLKDGEWTESQPTAEQRVSDLEEQLVQADETAIALYEAQEAQEVINAQQDEALMEIYEMIG